MLNINTVFTILFSILFLQLNAQKQKQVLFLGNSYTASNNLPNLIANIAESKGDSLIYDSNTPGGYTLNGHSSNTTSLQKINYREWDYVVLQEQSQLPSLSPESVALEVYPYAEILNTQIKNNNSCTRTLFFMTWGRKNGDTQYCNHYPPVCTYEGMQQRLRESYLEMGEMLNAEVAPVGTAWQYTRINNPKIELYRTDESHPNIYGSYLAACIFYSAIFHKSPVGSFKPDDISEEEALALQQNVAFVVLPADSLALWHIDTISTKAAFSYEAQGYNSFLFYNNSYNATDFYWDFGDNQSSTEIEPLHQYSEAGNYQVKLTAYNNCLIDSTEQTLATITTKELKQTQMFSVAPNPASDYIKITSAANTIIKQIEIHNSSGKQVFLRKIFNEENIKINTLSLKQGVYILQIETEKFFVHKKIIIVK